MKPTTPLILILLLTFTVVPVYEGENADKRGLELSKVDDETFLFDISA